MLHDRQRMRREFDSRRLRICYFRVHPLETFINSYESMLLNTTNCGAWRGENPGDPCYEVGEI